MRIYNNMSLNWYVIIEKMKDVIQKYVIYLIYMIEKERNHQGYERRVREFPFWILFNLSDQWTLPGDEIGMKGRIMQTAELLWYKALQHVESLYQT